MKKYILFFALLCVGQLGFAQQILSVKDQARVVDEILAERLNTLLPKLLEQQQRDMSSKSESSCLFFQALPTCVEKKTLKSQNKGSGL